jgi:hypothetical protein
VKTTLAAFLSAFLAFTATPAAAQAMMPCDVPGALRADRVRHGQAVNRLATLLEEYDRLEAQFTAHARQCSASGEPDEACRKAPLELQAARADYDRRRAEHKVQLLFALDSAAATIDARNQATRGLIADIPMANPEWTLDMERWMAISGDARARQRDEAFLAAVQFTVHRAKEASFLALEPGAGELGAVREWAQRHGGGALLPAAAKAAAQRARAARSLDEMLAVLDYVTEQHARFYRQAKRFEDDEDDKEEQAKKREAWESGTIALLDAIAKLASADPTVAGAARTARLWRDSDAFYAWAARLAVDGRLAELAELPEEAFREILRLGKQYIDDYRRLQELRRSRNLLAQLVC